MISVLFDLDDTLIEGRVIDTLALEYGFYYDLSRLKTNLNNQRISSKEFTLSIFKLSKGKHAQKVINVAKSMSLMPNTEKMFTSLRERGFKVGIISDSLTIVTDVFAERFNLDYSISHKAEITNGKLTGKVDLVSNSGNYLMWKRDKIRELREKTNSMIIAVGNGNIDAPMLKEADVGIAFNATPRAKSAADIIIDNKDMDEVLKAIDSLEL